MANYDGVVDSETPVESTECLDGSIDVQAKMNTDAFYTDAVTYWESIPATVNGVMGGFSNLSANDISGSKKFLLPFIKGPEATVGTNRALDCGAGIGRVSKRLLLPLFNEVDLEEQNPSFLEKAKEYLGESEKRVGQYFPVGLQAFYPPDGRHYDVIWCQWVLSHLRDIDLVSFLMRCSHALTFKSGIIVIKENVTKDEDDFDELDSSVTRCMDSFLRIFKEAGLVIIKQELQPKWPGNMFEVAIFALQPIVWR